MDLSDKRNTNHQNPFVWCNESNLHHKRDFSSNILCVPHDKTL